VNTMAIVLEEATTPDTVTVLEAVLGKVKRL
jgi:hypothetical protein